MSQTNAQKLKAKKRRARDKRLRKQANIERNLAPVRYRLDMLYEGHWLTGFRNFRKWAQVERHKADTEKKRAEGVEIAAANVVDLQTGKVVMEIAPSPPRAQGKGAVPDALENKPSAGKVARIFRKFRIHGRGSQ